MEQQDRFVRTLEQVDRFEFVGQDGLVLHSGPDAVIRARRDS